MMHFGISSVESNIATSINQAISKKYLKEFERVQAECKKKIDKIFEDMKESGEKFFEMYYSATPEERKRIARGAQIVNFGMTTLKCLNSCKKGVKKVCRIAQMSLVTVGAIACTIAAYKLASGYLDS